MTDVPETDAPQVSRQIPVTSTFTRDSLDWCSSANGGCTDVGQYVFLWKPVVFDGKIEICGVGSGTSDEVTAKSLVSMQRARAELNGNVILSDMSFFNNAGNDSNFRGVMANCRTTGITEPDEKWGVWFRVPSRSDEF